MRFNEKGVRNGRLLLFAFVVVAALARVEDEAAEVALDNGLDVALAATNDSDVVLLQNILGTLAHISCQHHLYAHLLEHGCNTRLTAAALGRR